MIVSFDDLRKMNEQKVKKTFRKLAQISVEEKIIENKITKCSSCEFLHKNCHFINDKEISPTCFDTMKQIQEEDAKPLEDWGDDEEIK